jgi:hypothetical protein
VQHGDNVAVVKVLKVFSLTIMLDQHHSPSRCILNVPSSVLGLLSSHEIKKEYSKIKHKV